MIIANLLDRLGEYLQEDFTYGVVWTRNELLGYLKQVVKMFCEQTGVVDKTLLQLVDGTTGEMSLPGDFQKVYMTQFNQKQVDIVALDELDFVIDGWLGGEKGTPLAAGLYGSGAEGVLRFVPVPERVNIPVGSGVTYGLVLSYGGVYYSVECSGGVLETGGTIPPSTAPVLAGPGSYWDLKVQTDGVLYTEPSSSTTPDWVVLTDLDGSGNQWVVRVTNEGVLYLERELTNYGVVVGGLLDIEGYQSFNQDYGILVDSYCNAGGGVGCRVSGVRGFGQACMSSDLAGMLWYKGSVEVEDYEGSFLWLNSGFEGVLVHGVLSLAFGHDGEGQDLAKAHLLSNIFLAECRAIREGVQSRWA